MGEICKANRFEVFLSVKWKNINCGKLDFNYLISIVKRSYLQI